MQLHDSFTISQTVECAIPNKWAMVRYFMGVAKYHRATTTRRLTDNAFRSTVSLFLNVGASLLQYIFILYYIASGRDINFLLPRLFTYCPCSRVQRNMAT